MFPNLKPGLVLVMLGIFLSVGHAQYLDKPVILWCDPLLNAERIHNVLGVSAIMRKVESAGIQAVALGVKSLTGEVIYESEVAPRLLDWQDKRLAITEDPVEVFLREAAQRNVRIYAVFNILSEGHLLHRRGPIYGEHQNWQTQVYVVQRDGPEVIPISQWAYGSAGFVNPHLQEVQNYEISVLREFLQEYQVSGVIFERLRFYGLESDFSETTRQQFEQWLPRGERLTWWPRDVYEWQYQNNQWVRVPGRFFQPWITFRAQTMKSFANRLTEAVRQVRPGLEVINYVGAWYPTYYEYGVNWSSPDYVVNEDWAGPDYPETSLLEYFDRLITKCYFPRVTIAEAEEVGAEWWISVEGAAMLSGEATNQEVPVYGAVLVELFKDDPERFKQALEAVLQNADGLCLYDLSYVEKYSYWDEIKEVLTGTESEGRPEVEEATNTEVKP